MVIYGEEKLILCENQQLTVANVLERQRKQKTPS